ncbi:UNVERIFIED_CONTAM: Retrovirus-related Pol polyprotein from type-2 retrotransposable element R2DM [Sesamum radiatum]|uniref:Retrovirus-related Pol polyprotein from type-2 retrotransposable element R2DM n=1 Tax=Sesamum radiatum TaxID=300843 RepID=A0AAW2PJA1_SESRA
MASSGRGITRAIMEFFRTDRLLKQVNSTLISLIPKVSNPTVVAKFRPISCCNVLYKIITKVLVQRMRTVLDLLISSSQNAFVPGRSIGDNILLAQELFYGYNQQHLPPRCALKVDLWKAYDIVEWDFLSAVLTFFGFPPRFITWIEECVTTPSFSVCLNGSPHGYFRGARGLRQGDPMSPFLFVLVMEALTLILHQLIDQDGRVQLIKSVLTTLQVYWAMAFILPKTIIREIEKRLCSFLWKGCTGVGYAKVSWQQVCRSVEEGGLGIRDILALNWGLMSRHLWRVIVADHSSIQVDWIIHYRLRGTSIWTVSDRTGSWGWRKLVRLRVYLRPYITYRVGLGSSFSLWHDPWHTLGPLILYFPLGPRHTATSPTTPLSLVIQDGQWHWPLITDMESIDITHTLPTIHGSQDRVIWTGPRDSFSSATAYAVFCPPGSKLECSSLLVGSLKIPRHRFILWLAILGRLSTLDKPWLQHMGTDCVLCRIRTPETHSHLFFSCPFALECLLKIRTMVDFHWPYNSWDLAIRWALARWRGKHVVNSSYKALLASLVYHIWEERNRRIFQQTDRTPVILARIIIAEIRDLIVSKNMPHSVSTRGLYRLWRIPWPVEGDANA